MSVQTLIAEAIAEVEKLFSHADPAVPALAQSVAGKLEEIKTAVVSDAEKLGSEAVADGKTLAGEAERDAAAVVGQATGATPAAPAKP